ncbi:MAG: flagellar hook-associated protein FlgK, partial [Sphingomonadaceae bacterium]|nr:flagellar hook-associated protein FlgK [Sphingomonadaceae bacterium]
TQGNKIYVDGVPLFPGVGANTTASGTLAAMVQLRDGYASEFQLQLDEVARGLISAFSETDPSNPANVLAGLFVEIGVAGVPPDGAVSVGLAGRIGLNALADPDQGGNSMLLRDGVNFNYNASGFGSFNERLLAYTDRIDAPSNFINSSGVSASQSLSAYSTAAIGWLEDARKTAAGAAEAKSALAIRSAESLSNLTSVNVDEEMALMLELEHSYSASAKMLQVVDEMLRTLLAAVR